ncbi:MAG: hypothetical protein WA634_09875 [Silvibacterium sp.]
MGFRANDEERAQIEAAAARAGLTTGSYIRARTLAKSTTRAVRRPPIETAQLAQLLGLLGTIGDTIRVLSEKHGVPAEEVQQTSAVFRKAAAAILEAMGKRPALLRDRGP